MALLEIDNVHAYYGNIHALKGISLEVGEGEIVCLIGSNGAGKSTTLKTISGLLHPRQGEIKLEGQRISDLPAHQIVDIVKEINAQGTTIMLVEQNALKALEVADRGYVPQPGTIVLDDTAESLQRNEMVRKAYLG